jgi:hypothetical protein
MNESILLLALLFLAHICGDFYFQPSSWVNDRYKKHLKSIRLYQHVLIHAVFVFTILLCAGYSLDIVLYGSVFILITHFFIDLVKSHLPRTSSYFFLDQIMHIMMLVIMWGCITNQYDKVMETLLLKIDYKLVVVLIAYIIVLKPAAIIISMLLEQWSEIARGSSNNSEDEEMSTTTKGEDIKSLVSAGKVIGMVERVLILTFVLLNQFSGVGFLLAAKSVFRFGDLKEKNDHKMTEYVMLGTLLSVTITLFVGIITLLITKGSIVIK